MKLIPSSRYIIFFSFFVTLLGWSQERNIVNDTLKAESVIIVKSYNPTINDAFKIEGSPSFEDPNKEAKQKTNYRIHSVPVASTFVPKKAKAIEVKKSEQERGTANYARLGAGNFTNVEAEAFIVVPTDKKSQFTAHLNHQSSQGGIDEVRLDDAFFDTSLKLGFDRFEKHKQFNGQLEVKHQLYNWYGLAEGNNLTQDQINQIDPSHSFIDANFKGNLLLDSEYVEGGKLLLRHFRDDFESTENHILINPVFISKPRRQDYEIQVPVRIEFLQNTFKTDLQDIEQSVFIGGVSPKIRLNLAGVDIEAGLGAFFGSDKLKDDSKLYVYPNFLATYKLFKYDFNMFASVTGGLDQNSYRSASEQNVFVAPALATSPTSRVYDAKAGINGSLLNALGFEFYVNAKNEEDFAFFVPNANLTGVTTSQKGYEYGNAFLYDYGDLKTTTFHGALQFDIDKKYGIALEVDYSNYSVSGQQEAWYLPELQGALKGYYVFTPQWKASSKLFFTGEREAFDTITQSSQTLDSYVDLNVQLDYQINKQWSAFVKGKNITNQPYERWLNYNVQTAQGLIGVRYNFDFK